MLFYVILLSHFLSPRFRVRFPGSFLPSSVQPLFTQKGVGFLSLSCFFLFFLELVLALVLPLLWLLFYLAAHIAHSKVCSYFSVAAWCSAF